MDTPRATDRRTNACSLPRSTARRAATRTTPTAPRSATDDRGSDELRSFSGSGRPDGCRHPRPGRRDRRRCRQTRVARRCPSPLARCRWWKLRRGHLCRPSPRRIRGCGAIHSDMEPRGSRMLALGTEKYIRSRWKTPVRRPHERRAVKIPEFRDVRFSTGSRRSGRGFREIWRSRRCRRRIGRLRFAHGRRIRPAFLRLQRTW